jgi:hypothetical protein
MDGDPGVESEVDSFSLVLPLPFRVAIILVLGRMLVFHEAQGSLTSNRSMGLGSESALSLPTQDCMWTDDCVRSDQLTCLGRSGAHSLSSTSYSTPHVAPPLNVSIGNLRYRPISCISPALLDHYSRQSGQGLGLSVDTAALPHLPRREHCHSFASPLSIRPITIRGDSEAHKYRQNS